MPYSCFYAATILVEEVAEAWEADPNDDSVLTEFCHAVDAKFLNVRSNLIHAMFQGNACIDAYNVLYPGSFAEVFDPLTSEQTPTMMCTQLVEEIETLLASGEGTEVNSLRYSYLDSQNTDLEVA